MKEYKVFVKGKEVKYGALVERSKFTEEEWMEIYKKMVQEDNLEFYEKYKGNDEVIILMGELIDLEERYEALLALLPQHKYSKAGTHPRWVADAVKDEMEK